MIERCSLIESAADAVFNEILHKAFLRKNRFQSHSIVDNQTNSFELRVIINDIDQHDLVTRFKISIK